MPDELECCIGLRGFRFGFGLYISICVPKMGCRNKMIGLQSNVDTPTVEDNDSAQQSSQ